MKCPNCGTQISCGCQLSTASNGKQVCSNCKSNYEQSITAGKKDDQVLTPEQKIILNG